VGRFQVVSCRVNLRAVGLLPMWMMILSRAPLMILVLILEFVLLPHEPLVGSLWVPLWGAISVCMYVNKDGVTVQCNKTYTTNL
jgi:hypothetical protein